MRDDTQLLNNGLDSELDSYDTAEDIKRTDYIYMVSGNNLVISLNAELDHHLADEVRDILDINKSERHIRGGMATRQKYLLLHRVN